MKKTLNNRQGFTLQEFLLVAVLISILSINMIVSSTIYMNEAHDRGVWTDLNTVFVDNIRFNIVDNQKLPSVDKIEEFLVENNFKVESSSENEDVLYIVNARLGRKDYSIDVSEKEIVVKAEYSNDKTIIAKYRVNETKTDVIVSYLEDTESA